MSGTPEPILAARDSWRAAMAALKCPQARSE